MAVAALAASDFTELFHFAMRARDGWPVGAVLVDRQGAGFESGCRAHTFLFCLLFPVFPDLFVGFCSSCAARVGGRLGV